MSRSQLYCGSFFGELLSLLEVEREGIQVQHLKQSCVNCSRDIITIIQYGNLLQQTRRMTQLELFFIQHTVEFDYCTATNCGS